MKIVSMDPIIMVVCMMMIMSMDGIILVVCNDDDYEHGRDYDGCEHDD